MRDLKSIEEEFVILNRYKEALNKEKETTTNKERLESIEKDLKAIDELMKELQIAVNEWANNYNQKEPEEEKLEKTTREKFEENKEKIKQIKNQSKALQPKFSSSDKKNKRQILLSQGFIETETVDNRKILIHPSLVGKYYDLVKEQRILSKLLYQEYLQERQEEREIKEIIEEESKKITDIPELYKAEQQVETEPEKEEQQTEIEPEKTLEEKIKEIENKINYIINEAHGKKMFVKYKGEKYYIPKADKGKFLAYMNQLNKLKKQKEENSAVKKIDINDIPEIIEPEHTSLMVVDEKYIPGTFILKPRERNPYETDEEYEKFLEEYYKKYYPEKEEQQEEGSEVRIIDDDDDIDDNKEENEEEEKIVAIRKPRFFDKIKRFIKKAKYVIAAALLLVGLKLGINKLNTQNVTPDPIPSGYENEETIPEDEIDEILETTESISDEEQIIPAEDIHEEEENSDLKLGQIVTINPDSKIYLSEDRAMTEEEQYQMTPYYKNNEEKRVILGLAISKDNKLYRVYACTEDGQAKIKELLNDGGKIESVLTGNIDRVEQLKKYDGKKTMSADEINNLAEGWYNINSIAFNNERGLVR